MSYKYKFGKPKTGAQRRNSPATDRGRNVQRNHARAIVSPPVNKYPAHDPQRKFTRGRPFKNGVKTGPGRVKIITRHRKGRAQ